MSTYTLSLETSRCQPFEHSQPILRLSPKSRSPDAQELRGFLGFLSDKTKERASPSQETKVRDRSGNSGEEFESRISPCPPRRRCQFSRELYEGGVCPAGRGVSRTTAAMQLDDDIRVGTNCGCVVVVRAEPTSPPMFRPRFPFSFSNSVVFRWDCEGGRIE